MGPHGSGYVGLAATPWVPMGARVLDCHQMTTQTHPGGDGRISEKIKFLKIFSGRMSTRK